VALVVGKKTHKWTKHPPADVTVHPIHHWRILHVPDLITI